MPNNNLSKLENQIDSLSNELENITDLSKKAKIISVISQCYIELEKFKDANQDAKKRIKRKNFELLIVIIVSVSLICAYFLSTLQPILKDIKLASERHAQIMTYELKLQKYKQDSTQQKLENREIILENTRKQLADLNENYQLNINQRIEVYNEKIDMLKKQIKHNEEHGETKAAETGKNLLNLTRTILEEAEKAAEKVNASSIDFIKDVRVQETSIVNSNIKLEYYRSGHADQPRGIRNNNPVLVAKDSWLGLMSTQQMTFEQKNEQKFAVFLHPTYGFRAGAKVILRQQREAGKTISVNEQLNIWFGNTNTRKVAAKKISKALNVDPNSPIDLSNRENLITFLEELAKFHNNVTELPYSKSIVEEGIALASLKP